MYRLSRMLVVCSVVAALGVLGACPTPAASAPDSDDAELKKTRAIMAKYQPNIDKGLAYLKKEQRRGGYWDVGGQNKIPMTGLVGMALLAEGSTPTQGKFSKELDDAVEFLIKRCQKNGMIGDPTDQEDRHRYMYGHGFCLMFLATVYGEETDAKRRRDLETVLTRAVEFTAKAQTSLGGWGYVSAADGQDFDEGSVTITQIQSLRAARNAGIPVPKNCIEKAYEYMNKSTTITMPNADKKKEEGGVVYSLRHGVGGGARPALTAAGVACRFNAGDYSSEYVVKWINYLNRNVININRGGGRRFGHDEYTLYYLSQVVYILGEDRHAKMRPDLDDKDLIKWSRFREVLFANLAQSQQPDGSWQGGVGAVYCTALYLTIMQLDKANLPIYQR